MPDFRLETERLILRDWREEDWEPFFRHTNTPSVMRWLGGVLDDEARSRMCERLESYKRQHGHNFWIVERKQSGGHLSGELLGFCGLKRANQKGAPIGDFEIGWRLREDAWGRGYAREAAEASMAAGFEVFGAPHIIALTVEGNKASWGLMRRLGMCRRSDLDFDSTDFEPEGGTILVYSITREEWNAR
jgi:RimJ/RimL family protein N-acetyltransferase